MNQGEPRDWVKAMEVDARLGAHEVAVDDVLEKEGSVKDILDNLKGYALEVEAKGSIKTSEQVAINSHIRQQGELASTLEGEYARSMLQFMQSSKKRLAEGLLSEEEFNRLSEQVMEAGKRINGYNDEIVKVQERIYERIFATKD